MGGFTAPKLDTVRWGAIGVGARGSSHVKHLAQIEGSEVVAISDLYEDLTAESKKNAEKAGRGKRHTDVKLYHGDQDAWKTMLKEARPDAVFISTPWSLHAPMAIETMKSGSLEVASLQSYS